MQTETFDQAMNDKHIKTSHGTLDESVSSKHSDSSRGVIDRSGNSMRSEGENPDMILHSDRKYDFNALIDGTGNALTSVKSSSSVSSSESSSDDLFQIDAVFTKSETSTAFFNDMGPETKDEMNDLSSQSSDNSESDSGSPGPTSTSQVYDAIPDLIDMLPTSIPPIQVMDRSAGYEPYRIPSSVFKRNKSNNPMDWSGASNDSLFSIQLGNNSFSKDHLFMLGELGKSGELYKSGELHMFSSRPPIILEEDLQTTGMANEALESEQRASKDQKEVKNSNPAISCMSSSVSSLSHASKQSFAFPMAKHAWPSSYCSNCSWAICYKKWPCCYCSNCSWAFCYACLTEAERVNSPKTDVPRQQTEKEAPEVTSNSTANSYCCQCYSWSCCSWGNCCQFRCHCPCCHCRCCQYHCC